MQPLVRMQEELSSHLFVTSKEWKLPYPPIGLAVVDGSLYAATKSKHLFSFALDGSKRERLPFPEQITALANSDTTLYCGCKDGKLISILKNKPTSFKASLGTTPLTCIAFNNSTSDIIASSNSAKIAIFSKEGILRRTEYLFNTPASSFSLSKDGKLAILSQNNRTIRIIESLSDSKKDIQLKEGFPESVLFLKNNLLLVGTGKGKLLLFNIRSADKLAECDIQHGIHTLFLYQTNVVFAGTVGGTLVLLKILNKTIEIIESKEMDGIPTAFELVDTAVAVAISREPRIGKWGRIKNGKNKVILLQCTETLQK